MKPKILPRSILFFLLVAGVAAWAQPAAVQQFQNNQTSRQMQPPTVNLAAGTNAPELYPGESGDVGPQRILRVNPRPTYFDVLLDSQVFYSDNADYANAAHAIGSSVFVNTIQAALAPPSFNLGKGQAAVAVGGASQWYNYGNNTLQNLDFDAQTLFLSGKYTLDKWQAGLGFNFTRLLNQSDYEKTYSEFMPNFGVQRVLPLNDRMYFALGDLVDYHLTEVPSVFNSRSQINNRFDNILSLTYTWQATRHFVLQPYYRFQYSYYEYNTTATSYRQDYLQSFGLAAAYYFNAKISVRAFYNYNSRQSTDQFTPHYKEMNGGVGATLDIKF